MGHEHNHAPAKFENLNRAFIIGIGLNAIFVIVEIMAGLYSGSLALLTDAGHNLSDVASLALALLAFKLSKVKPTETYTYGFQKTTILVALANAVILLVAVGIIGWEATQRLFNPEPAPGKIIALVAGIGLIINSVTALLFFRDKEHDLNIKGAYLHLAADALVSLGVVITGILIYYTNWFWLDSAISFIIIIVIFMGTWSLLKDTLRLSLDGVPKNLNLEEIKNIILQNPEITAVHHVHIWAVSTTQNALTAHLVLTDTTGMQELPAIKERVMKQLSGLNIHHYTLETELAGQVCNYSSC